MTYANPQTAGTNNPGMHPSDSMNQAPSAGFVAGAAAASLGIERSIERRVGAPASSHLAAAPRLALAVAAEFDSPERGPLTPAAKRATASAPQHGRSGL